MSDRLGSGRTQSQKAQAVIRRSLERLRREGETPTSRAVALETGLPERFVRHTMQVTGGHLRADVLKHRQAVLQCLSALIDRGRPVRALDIAARTGLSRQAVARHLAAYYGTPHWKGVYIRETYLRLLASGTPTLQAVADCTGYSRPTIRKYLDQIGKEAPPAFMYLFARDVFFSIAREAMKGSFRHQLLYMQIFYGFSPKNIDRYRLPVSALKTMVARPLKGRT